MKAIMFILSLFCLSCTGKHSKDYVITYKVYYPSNTTIKKFSCHCYDIRTYSSKGSNSIRYRVGEFICSSYVFIEDTSAPIEIVNIQQSK